MEEHEVKGGQMTAEVKTTHFWQDIVAQVEAHLTDEEYERMEFDAHAEPGYGLADNYPKIIGYIKVNSQSARDKVMRIIHNNVRLATTGLEIKYYNLSDRNWFVVFVPA